MPKPVVMRGFRAGGKNNSVLVDDVLQGEQRIQKKHILHVFFIVQRQIV
jgi:hypothetical protein